MNDDFLHRLRREPPPGFLAELKAKLDRQSAPARPRRLSFSRGLVVGLLLATTAFAVTSLSINSAPKSLHAFLAAPVELVARMSSSPSQSEDRQLHGPVPLGPAWLPTHVAPQPQGDALEANPPASATAVPAPPIPEEAKSSSTQPAATPTGYEILDVIATASAFPHAQTVADHFGKNFGQLRVSSDMNGTALNSLCNPDSKGNPSVAELYHRLTPAELRTCPLKLTEFAVGHQAIVLARGRLYGPLRLSARALFLALARQVPMPMPTDPTQLIDNPNTTWNQVDSTLPYDRIHVFGPELGWVQEKLAAALLLEAGCDTYPWIAELRTSDPARYDRICKTVRSDGAYEGNAAGGWALSDNLVHDPTTLGIYTLSEFARSEDQLVANLIDGVEPTPETIVAGTYPAARTLYLYVNRRYWGNSLFDRLLAAYLLPLNLYGSDPAGWGFIALDAAERAEVQATLKRYSDFRY
ncbi:MAG TPA: substrate-binding domain-containing protein [Steroidobacteraceae bacterium]|nr:substrate-binding domain-containing protein [Steroidobacteraceae bacterium]